MTHEKHLLGEKLTLKFQLNCLVGIAQKTCQRVMFV